MTKWGNGRHIVPQCYYKTVGTGDMMKFIRFLLGTLAITAALATQLHAQFLYTVNGGMVTITKYTGSSGIVIIPSTMNVGGVDLPVTTIGDSAFWGYERLFRLTIPDSVTKIAPRAFTYSWVTDVNFGNGIISIGDSAFNSCFVLSSVTLPNSLTSIGNSSFSGCSRLANLILGNNLKTIAPYAFDGCTSLTILTIPDSVTIVGNAAFHGCGIKALTIGNGLTSIADDMFSSCSLTNLCIPNTVTNIGGLAFGYCYYLQSASIGSGVTSIEPEAFASCNLLQAITVDTNNPAFSSLDGVLFSKGKDTLVEFPGGKLPPYTMPDSVTRIAPFAFYYRYFTDVTMSPNLSSIGEYAFAYSSLNRVTIPGGVSTIGNYAFYCCAALTNATLSTNHTSIGGNAFARCGLSHVTMPEGLNSIGDYAFDYCAGLTSIAIPNSVTGIAYGAFRYCNGLSSATIGDSVTSLADRVFDGCSSLTNVTIGNSVTSIGDYAFSWCTSLPNVTIPSSVSTIGIAFPNCTNLARAYFGGNAPSANSSVFVGDNKATIYYLPGTTGWMSTFGGRPTALWFLPNPLILSSPSFGVQTNAFGFIVSWATNLSLVVEGCTNPANPMWLPLQTCTLVNGSIYFSDPDWTNYPSRLYRIRSP